MAVLDLSQVEQAPVKVKLPDGGLYDMAAPGNLSPRQLQRLLSRYRRAQELMQLDAASDAEADEMFALLVDVAGIIVPDAPREVLADLGAVKLMRLGEAFSTVSPESPARVETSTSV